MATRSFEPSLQQLRELVLDYLIHNAYIDTARTFASESATVAHANEIQEGLASDASSAEANGHPMEGVCVLKGEDSCLNEKELEQVRRRREIQLHILSGRVDEATQLLYTYFPMVLQENDLDLPTSTSRGPPDTTSPFTRLQYTSQNSVKPIHIALNLRILAFVEASRTVPLIYPGDPKRFSSIALAGANRSADEYSAHQIALLHHAQRLYATVESLRDSRERETYRKQLNGVGGLLAYSEPEKSPIAGYLSQDLRDAVANQVNSAILYHMGKLATSHIELYVRETSTVVSVMRDINIPPTPQMRSLLPIESVTQVSPSSPQSKLPSGKTEKQEKAEQEKPPACPSFNLSQFLDNP
ncbi:hypothetical protein ACEPAI_4608 [Sanghuangporus weigelae]